MASKISLSDFTSGGQFSFAVLGEHAWGCKQGHLDNDAVGDAGIGIVLICHVRHGWSEQLQDVIHVA